MKGPGTLPGARQKAPLHERWTAMKALLCTRYGKPDDLELADIAEPQAGPGEAVVKIHAAALNFFDTLIIAGKYQFKPEPPFSPERSRALAQVSRRSKQATGCWAT